MGRDMRYVYTAVVLVLWPSSAAAVLELASVPAEMAFAGNACQRRVRLVLLLATVGIAGLSGFRAHTANNYLEHREISQVDEEASAYCAVCRAIKPERTHHCRRCERCVQRMDHHCSWIANCVGEKNHKFFILFLLYMFVASVEFTAIVSRYVTDPVFTDVFGSWSIVLIGVAAVVAAFGSVFCGSLLVWNVYLSSINVTNVEYYIRSKAVREGQPRSTINSHDRGLCTNLKEVYGHNYLRWLVPI
mmetsp:Transcript_7805/g.23589  ORF Transcript_7805/g.23589 Transcript_7805/m.23589 type:complete len:246 (-) Transcript_7805:350-1087(-)